MPDLRKRYWDNEGPRQALYDSLYKIYVPTEGEAPTKEGEVIRCVSRLYYDLFTNGGGNFDLEYYHDMYRTLYRALDDNKAKERLISLFKRKDKTVADQLVEDCLDLALTLINAKRRDEQEY
jgi:hypothetical protein